MTSVLSGNVWIEALGWLKTVAKTALKSSAVPQNLLQCHSSTWYWKEYYCFVKIYNIRKVCQGLCCLRELLHSWLDLRLLQRRILFSVSMSCSAGCPFADKQSPVALKDLKLLEWSKEQDWIYELFALNTLGQESVYPLVPLLHQHVHIRPAVGRKRRIIHQLIQKFVVGRAKTVLGSFCIMIFDILSDSWETSENSVFKSSELFWPLHNRWATDTEKNFAVFRWMLAYWTV